MPPLIRNLLVPLDGSRAAEASLCHVRTLARRFGARIHLTRMVASGKSGFADDPVQWRVERSEAASYLQYVASSLDDDLEVETAVPAGRPDDEIVAHAERHDVDLLILSPRGRGQCRGPMGGTAHKIVDRAGLQMDPVVETSDSATRRLQEIAEERGVDLVILNARGRSGEPTGPYGGLVASLLVHGTRSTLVLRDRPRTPGVRRPDRGHRSLRSDDRPARPERALG